MDLQYGKKIYFASDFHLGSPNAAQSRIREEAIIRWLDHAALDAQEIYLVGDVFDFWFEYKFVIPKGFARLQGKLAQLTDAGIPVHFFSGNHDMWGLDYFHDELGLILHKEPITTVYNNKTFYIGHGDGLGPGDETYKLMKKAFTSPACHWLFSHLHPNIGMSIANLWSNTSRKTHKEKDEFHGNDKEWLAIYAREVLQHSAIDYFIFGHRHLPLNIQLTEKSRYVNLGEWINYQSYAVFNGLDLSLTYWNEEAAQTLLR